MTCCGRRWVGWRRRTVRGVGRGLAHERRHHPDAGVVPTERVQLVLGEHSAALLVVVTRRVVHRVMEERGHRDRGGVVRRLVALGHGGLELADVTDDPHHVPHPVIAAVRLAVPGDQIVEHLPRAARRRGDGAPGRPELDLVTHAISVSVVVHVLQRANVGGCRCARLLAGGCADRRSVVVVAWPALVSHGVGHVAR